VRVRDTGIGIPQKDLPHIFEEFYRGDNAIKEHNSGFGFGLSMIKEAVDIHNGKTSVQSELGKGTCFSIEIPAGNIQDHST
jgi:signal transduction histidine kinase